MRFAHVTGPCARDISVSKLFKDLKWQDFETRKDYFPNMLNRCIRGSAPVRLCNEIEMFYDRHGFNTRNSDSLNVVPNQIPNFLSNLSDIQAPKRGILSPMSYKIIIPYPPFKRHYKQKHF